VDERARFDTSAGLPMCTAQPPEGRGPWRARVNPTLSARYARAPARGLLRVWRSAVRGRTHSVRHIGRIADVHGAAARRARAMEGPSESHSLRYARAPARGLLRIWRSAVRGRTRSVRHIGRIADVHGAAARRARAMEGPSESHALRYARAPARGLFRIWRSAVRTGCWRMGKIDNGGDADGCRPRQRTLQERRKTTCRDRSNHDACEEIQCRSAHASH